MNIAVCDDSKRDTEQICALLNEHFNKNGYTGQLHTFQSGEALLDAFSAQKYDAVFLDIYMEGMNGIETAAKLREYDPYFTLVFITASRAHAIESYSQRALSYVPKPIKRKDIDNAFAVCQSMFIKNARFVEVMSDRSKIKIPLVKILYIETYGRETLFHTADRTIRSTESLLLDDLEQTLGDSFLRCNRSYIVNMNQIDKVLPDDFRMRNGDLVPMRQRGRAKLRETYADFISDRLFEAPS